MSKTNIIHFPVDRIMPTRVAEERLGRVIMYKYPDPSKINMSMQEWLEKWLSQKMVLLGWESVKKGIVSSFKGGRVRHRVSQIEEVDIGERPKVELGCSFDLFPVWNWECDESVKSVPVVILGIDQTSYFRECKLCFPGLSNFTGGSRCQRN